MATGFLDPIRQDLNFVDLKVEKAFKIKPGHISKFAHLDTNSLLKYLHPAVVLFCGRLFNYIDEKLIYLASAVHLISAAAGVQFGVPDDNDRQRHDIDPRDGSQLPVLVGDYLYGRFFTGLCDGGILEFLTPLATIIGEINYGALLRRKNAGQPITDVKFAMLIIEKETALLLEGAARMAGILAGASEVEVARLGDFGRNLGMAYGIIERNLDPNLADPYFEQALKALNGLPDCPDRENLGEIIKRIRDGEISVPAKKLGRSQDPELSGEKPFFHGDYNDKEEYVHSIFSAIARKYDTINSVLSFNQDKQWRRFTVEQTGLKQGGYALDVCCGTGGLSLELAKKVGSTGKVVGLDFCEDMLAVARQNLQGSQKENVVEYVQGNAMEIPFPDNTFDCATIGFGLRNVPDVSKTLREMIRVVRPGGRVVCLEFSKPSVPVFKQIYNFYFDKCVPLLGKIGLGMQNPYKYLHNAWKAFPHQKELCNEFSRQGLQEATYYELTGGVVSIHLGVKPLDSTVSSVAATQE